MKSYKTTRRKLSTGIKLSTNGSDQLFNASICLLDTRDILCWTKFSFVATTVISLLFAPDSIAVPVPLSNCVEVADEAVVKLLKENDWIIDAEYNIAEFILYELL